MKLRELLSQLKEVQQEIGSSEPYLCGGTPRDRYLKHLENVADIDITTGDSSVHYLASEYYNFLKKKYNVKMTTAPDGHNTIFIGNIKLDFSSNFNAPNIDQILHKMGIAKPTEMQKEMFSRDFTCNTLLLSLDLKNVIDPTHLGFKDINNKKIKTCLAPEITLTTNRNRIIRAIYLATKLDFDIDDSIIKFVQAHPETADISTEKVMSEKTTDAFMRDGDKASFYVTKMNLWNHIPITEAVYPYYIKNVQRSANGTK